MRTPSIIPMRIRHLLYCAAFILIGGLAMVSCNTEPSNSAVLDAGPKYWIVLNLKFKNNTTREIRDETIKAIQQLIFRQVSALRAGNTEIKPYFITRQDPFGDSLACQIRVGGDVPTFGSYAIASSTLPPPTCTCLNKCGVCDTLRNQAYYNPAVFNALSPRSKRDSASNMWVKYSDVIESFETLDVNSKGK